jgi:hypothetical protein
MRANGGAGTGTYAINPSDDSIFRRLPLIRAPSIPCRKSRQAPNPFAPKVLPMSPEWTRGELAPGRNGTVDTRIFRPGICLCKPLINKHKPQETRTQLARISRQPSTAAADPGMSTALRSVGLLDILSSMPAGLSETYIVTLGAKRQAPCPSAPPRYEIW